jgi:hypothetical protein
MRKAETSETMQQIISDSDKSETQHIEFKSDSFSCTMSNKSKNFLRGHDLEIESIEEHCDTIPDELAAVFIKSHHQI